MSLWTNGRWGSLLPVTGYPQVNTFADLPLATSSTGKVYLVLTATGVWPFNRKPAGLYRSNGATWDYMSAYPDLMSDANFGIQNSTDGTKVVKFDASGITTGNTRTLKTLDSSGTLGYSLITTSVKTANYTANPFELIPCDISGGSFAITLPTSPVAGTVIQVKLVTIGTNRILSVNCGGTDKFNTATGNSSIFMTLDGEIMSYQYNSGVWYVFASSSTFNYATNFPGIDATTPITNDNITFDTTARTMTIVPPLGYFNIFVDGGGVIRRYRKTGNITFPAWTDTSGQWFFYFDSTGTAVTTQTPWTGADFASIAPVYRIVWNNTLVGSTKLVAQYVEYHLNTIPAETHRWEHANGAIWMNGFTIASNAIATGTPNADGRNSVLAITTGTNSDENLSYTVTNSTGGLAWQQDLGNTAPASLNATNSALFKVFVQEVSGNISFLPATRFPFPFNATTNLPEFITASGVRTTMANGDFLPIFIYATQNPVNGEALKVLTWTADFTTITNARAITVADVQATYPAFSNDREIRPLYRFIIEYRTTYDIACKKAVIREIQDLRQAAVTSTSTATGSIPASSVTNVPAGTISATNVQAAIDELASEKAPLDSPVFTGLPSIKGTSGDTSTGGILRYDTITGTNDIGLKFGAVSGASTAGYVWLQGLHTGVANDGGICLNPSGGNILLGTTKDNGGKLQVNGSIRTQTSDLNISTNTGSLSVLTTVATTGATDTTLQAYKNGVSAYGNLNFNPDGGSICIGTTTVFPTAQVSISNQAFAIVGATVTTDNTNKNFRLGCAHYANAEEPLVALFATSQNDDNIVSIGGGTSLGNAATSVRIYTAADRTTLTGTLRFEVTSVGNVEVANYTKLGSDAPSIKMKKFTGTTASTQGGNTAIAHGVTASKIIAIYGTVNYATNSYLAFCSPEVGYQVQAQYGATNVVAYNVPSNSASVLSKPFNITILYEE